MESVESGIANLISSMASEKPDAVRIARNNAAFERAVRRTWPDNPAAALYVLAHVNGLYVARDERPRKQAAEAPDRFIMGVYLDDPTAKAELNARREMLVLRAKNEGLHFEELIIHTATWGMKERRLYPHALTELRGELPEGTSASGASEPKRDTIAEVPGSPRGSRNGGATSASLQAQDQSRMLETMKRAFCMAFEDFESAAQLLDLVKGAAFEEVSTTASSAGMARERRSPRARKGSEHWCADHWCHLFVSDSDRPTVVRVLQAYGPAALSGIRPLGLRVRGFVVHEAPTAMHGKRAFPRLGAPVATTGIEPDTLRAYRLHALKEDPASIIQ